jgi:hypothetical protein
VGSDDDLHDALNAAIKSNERHGSAKERIEQSKTLKREADGLIETSRELVDASKRRIAKYAKASPTTARQA